MRSLVEAKQTQISWARLLNHLFWKMLRCTCASSVKQTIDVIVGLALKGVNCQAFLLGVIVLDRAAEISWPTLGLIDADESENRMSRGYTQA